MNDETPICYGYKIDSSEYDSGKMLKLINKAESERELFGLQEPLTADELVEFISGYEDRNGSFNRRFNGVFSILYDIIGCDIIIAEKPEDCDFAYDTVFGIRSFPSACPWNYESHSEWYNSAIEEFEEKTNVDPHNKNAVRKFLRNQLEQVFTVEYLDDIECDEYDCRYENPGFHRYIVRD